MQEAEIIAAVAVIARDTFGAPGAVITRDTTADDIDGWDSLNHALFLMNLEIAFSLRFNPIDVVNLENVGELVDLIGRIKTN